MRNFTYYEAEKFLKEIAKDKAIDIDNFDLKQMHIFDVVNLDEFQGLDETTLIKALQAVVDSNETLIFELEFENIHKYLRLEINSRRVFIKNREMNLTAKEFDMLELFATHPGKVYSRDQLLNTIWGKEYPGDVRTVDVHVRRLREKIEPNPGQPEYIYTKWGVGYYFKD